MMISIFLDKVKFWFHEAALQDRIHYALAHDFRAKTLLHAYSFQTILVTFITVLWLIFGFPFQAQASSRIGEPSPVFYNTDFEKLIKESQTLKSNGNAPPPITRDSFTVTPAPVPEKPAMRTPPAPTTTPDEAQMYAQSLVGSGEQWSCLYSLWAKESGWRVNAHNTSSGAYGIPQALPGSKMASVGADWETSYVTQIQWGLSYINGRYGSPCGAWEHSQQVGWY